MIQQIFDELLKEQEKFTDNFFVTNKIIKSSSQADDAEHSSHHLFMLMKIAELRFLFSKIAFNQKKQNEEKNDNRNNETTKPS